MKTALLLLVVTSILSLTASAAEEARKDLLLPGRPETTVTLKFSGNVTKTMVYPPSAYVSPQGVISILVGETLTFEFDVIDGELRNLRHVADPEQESRPGTERLTLELTQDAEITQLLREQSGDRPIAMKCATQSYGEEKVRHTRLNPLSRLPYGDSWPNTVSAVFLGELKFAKEEKP